MTKPTQLRIIYLAPNNSFIVCYATDTNHPVFGYYRYALITLQNDAYIWQGDTEDPKLDRWQQVSWEGLSDRVQIVIKENLLNDND